MAVRRSPPKPSGPAFDSFSAREAFALHFLRSGGGASVAADGSLVLRDRSTLSAAYSSAYAAIRSEAAVSPGGVMAALREWR